MAHEQAELTTFNFLLGHPDDVVTITDVELHFKNTLAANAGIGYRCAGCKVKVHAVIPKPTKTGRIKSPSSYFSSSPRKHLKGCTRLPTSAPSGSAIKSKMKARPTKAKFPTAWNDLPSALIATSGGASELGVKGLSGTTINGVRVTAGGGEVSKSDTGVVKRVALAYLMMTATELDRTNFKADWNPGGTYATAFEVPRNGSITATPDTNMHIYLAEVESTFKGTSGHIITLKPRHADGKELRL